MASQAKQKNKLLVLKELFEQQTNENHAMTVQEIISALNRKGISAERKTVYDDIATLTDSGFDIVVRKRGHANEYYLGSRLFQTVELCILADAVASCRFLTQKKSAELISKLCKLTDKHTAPMLSRSVHVSSRAKAFNERIYYNVNFVHEAIKDNKKLAFKIAYYDIEKRKRLRHDGLVYKVSPYYLTWEDDNYYLVCYCEKHRGISRYRVDRMENVTVCDEDRIKLSIDEEALAKSQCSVYSMYGGNERTVTLEFDKDLMNVVIDRFGQRIVCKKIDENRFRITVNIQLSPPFWGWLFKFGNKARIIEPAEVIEQARGVLGEIAEMYTPEAATV